MNGFAVFGLGFLLLLVGGTWWKLKMAKKSTPYVLLTGAALCSGATLAGIVRGLMGTGTEALSGVLQHLGMPIGAGTILLGVSLVLGIYLWKGLHPKKGEFKKGHNVAAIFAGITWGATGGIFGTIVSALVAAANSAGPVTAFLGQ
jgi:hypothetical protein